jgi:hypothetical protein
MLPADVTATNGHQDCHTGKQVPAHPERLLGWLERIKTSSKYGISIGNSSARRDRSAQPFSISSIPVGCGLKGVRSSVLVIPAEW